MAAERLHFEFVKVAERNRRWIGQEGFCLAGIETVLSGAMMLVTYALIIFAAYKVFQIGTDVAEMKQLLKDIRRNTSTPDAASGSAPQPPPLRVNAAPNSAEELVRAVHAASYEDLDEIASPRKLP
jgi:hypothetical protein